MLQLVQPALPGLVLIRPRVSRWELPGATCGRPDWRAGSHGQRQMRPAQRLPRPGSGPALQAPTLPCPGAAPTRQARAQACRGPLLRRWAPWQPRPGSALAGSAYRLRCAGMRPRDNGGRCWCRRVAQRSAPASPGCRGAMPSTRRLLCHASGRRSLHRLHRRPATRRPMGRWCFVSARSISHRPARSIFGSAAAGMADASTSGRPCA